MEIRSWEDLVYEFDNWVDTPEWQNGQVEILVNAEPFIEYNLEGVSPEDYDEYDDAFRAYAESEYISVVDIVDNPDKNCLEIEGEPYSFAIPIGADVEFELRPW